MLIENLERRLKGEADLEKVKAELREEILAILKPMEKPIQIPDGPKPFVIMVVGVNGTGKTTSIGKLALRFKNQGLRVMLAAADTFRAASVEQLQIWAKRANAEIVSHASGANPSAVCFDAISAAKSKGIDVVIIDTAGRLHTRASLMDELKKIKRVSEKALERKIDETLLVLDATTGQNAIEQAKIFHQELVVSGIILTKLDGTAKGGIIIPIADQFRIPIRLIGVGEEIEDLADFEAQEFVKALL
jgi:fused signal recognition particle receptor